MGPDPHCGGRNCSHNCWNLRDRSCPGVSTGYAAGSLGPYDSSRSAPLVYGRSYRLHRATSMLLCSIVSGVLMLAFFVAFAIASMHEGLAGLWERISLGFGMVWVAVVALRI